MWHLQDPKRKHDSRQDLLPQRQVQAQDKGNRDQHDPDVDGDSDEGARPEDVVGANTGATATTFPGCPVVFDRRTAEQDGTVKRDAAGDDQHKAELDQPPCQGNVAENPLIEEQDR